MHLTAAAAGGRRERHAGELRAGAEEGQHPEWHSRRLWSAGHRRARRREEAARLLRKWRRQGQAAVTLQSVTTVSRHPVIAVRGDVRFQRGGIATLPRAIHVADGVGEGWLESSSAFVAQNQSVQFADPLTRTATFVDKLACALGGDAFSRHSSNRPVLMACPCRWKSCGLPLIPSCLTAQIAVRCMARLGCCCYALLILLLLLCAQLPQEQPQAPCSLHQHR